MLTHWFTIADENIHVGPVGFSMSNRSQRAKLQMRVPADQCIDLLSEYCACGPSAGLQG